MIHTIKLNVSDDAYPHLMYLFKNLNTSDVQVVEDILLYKDDSTQQLDLYNTIAQQNLSQEQYIETLKQSEFLNVKTFEELFGITASRQKALRSRLHDPLPCFQMGDNTMILYKREEVVKWLENYNKN